MVSEEKLFEIVDGRRMETAYTISSPGAFGSGELKSNDNNILNCNIMIISFSSKIILFGVFFIFFYFIFKSGFTPCADIVNQIHALQTIGQVRGIRLTTVIRHESRRVLSRG